MTRLRWAAITGLLGLTLAFCFVGNSYQVFLVALVALTTTVGVGLNVLFGLSGFYTPDGGAVTLGERQVLGLPSHAVARLGIARTYQTSQLFPTLSVLENLPIALW